MAEIKRYPFFRHLRAEPTNHVLGYRNGTLRREGAGQAFWFRAINTAIAEVPIDDRELPFLFHVRSADFQELTVQGAIAFRVADPRLLARRVDFTIELAHGTWTQAPLEQVAGLLTQLAQQFVIDELVRLDLQTGHWSQAPLEQVAGLLTQLAQLGQFDHLTVTPDLVASLLNGR